MQHGRLSSLALSASLLLVGATACDGGGTGGSGGTGGGGAGGAGGGGAGGIGGGGAGGAADVPVTVAFGAKVGAEDFSCSVQFSNLGTTGATATLLDLRFYVHDVRLLSGAAETPITLDEDAFQLGDVALLDFEDKSGTCANGTTEVNTSIRGTAPAGAYDGVRFRLGLPFEQNHQDKDQASSPLNLSALFWDWQAGYKFVRADAREKDAATPFNFHLGSTGCDGDPVTGGTTQCSRENVVEITLSPFDPVTDVVVFDYAALVAGVDLIADGGGAPGCMSGTSDPECGAMFDALGIDIATGAIDPSAQLVFSVQ